MFNVRLGWKGLLHCSSGERKTPPSFLCVSLGARPKRLTTVNTVSVLLVHNQIATPRTAVHPPMPTPTAEDVWCQTITSSSPTLQDCSSHQPLFEPSPIHPLDHLPAPLSLSSSSVHHSPVETTSHADGTVENASQQHHRHSSPYQQQQHQRHHTNNTRVSSYSCLHTSLESPGTTRVSASMMNRNYSSKKTRSHSPSDSTTTTKSTTASQPAPDPSKLPEITLEMSSPPPLPYAQYRGQGKPLQKR